MQTESKNAACLAALHAAPQRLTCQWGGGALRGELASEAAAVSQRDRKS